MSQVRVLRIGFEFIEYKIVVTSTSACNANAFCGVFCGSWGLGSGTEHIECITLGVIGVVVNAVANVCVC